MGRTVDMVEFTLFVARSYVYGVWGQDSLAHLSFFVSFSHAWMPFFSTINNFIEYVIYCFIVTPSTRSFAIPLIRDNDLLLNAVSTNMPTILYAALVSIYLWPKTCRCSLVSSQSVEFSRSAMAKFMSSTERQNIRVTDDRRRKMGTYVRRKRVMIVTGNTCEDNNLSLINNKP